MRPEILTLAENIRALYMSAEPGSAFRKSLFLLQNQYDEIFVNVYDLALKELGMAIRSAMQAQRNSFVKDLKKDES